MIDYATLTNLISMVLIIVLALFTYRFRNWYVALVLTISLTSAVLKSSQHQHIAVLTVINQGLLAYLIYRYMVLDDYNKHMAIKAYLAQIVEGAQLAVIGIDKDGRIVSWNMGAQQIYGFEISEVQGMNIIDAIVPDHERERATGHLDQVLSGKKIQVYQAPRCTKNGDQILVENTLSPIFNADGKLVGASSISQPIKEVII